MGLEAGWVCDVPGLTRNQMLKALGNGVVPQQAAAAWRALSVINPLKETA
jgi:DNA (cytosine-5)-methyltransferase 1